MPVLTKLYKSKYLFLILSAVLLTATVVYASTQTVFFEAENATLSDGAVTGSDSNASGGGYVKFGSDATDDTSEDSRVVDMAGWEVDQSVVGPSGCGASLDGLSSSGSVTSEYDGQVIEGLDIAGTVTISHNNVTIRNSRIRAGGVDTYAISYGPTFGSGLGGTTVECVEIDGQDSTSVGVLLQGTGQEVRNSYIHSYRVGVHWRGNDTWVNNLIDDLYYDADSHNTSGSIRGQNVELLGNRFGDGNSAAVAIYPDSHPKVVIKYVDLIENFWQTPAANYCVNFGIGGDSEYAQQSSHVRVVRNMWGQDYSSVCGMSGPYHSWDPDREGNEWTDNVYQNGDAIEG